jgi:hypothetical protein
MPVLNPAWRGIWNPGSSPSGTSSHSETRYACEDKACPAEPVTARGYDPKKNPKRCPVHQASGVRKLMNRPAVRA